MQTNENQCKPTHAEAARKVRGVLRRLARIGLDQTVTLSVRLKKGEAVSVHVVSMPIDADTDD